MELAPIAVSTYKRADHLARTLSALKECRLAKKSDLFVFSDAPIPGDEAAVAQVRQIASSTSGFRSVTVVERSSNNRVENNRGGIRSLLDQHGCCIFLEEDVVTAPGFLVFMNDGLKRFQYSKKVFAVCAYTPPLQLEKIHSTNSYICPRFAAWGFGIWSNRYDLIEQGPISSKQLSFWQSSRLRLKGVDLLDMLSRIENGDLEALDVRINFSMARRNMSVVCPTRSLALNEGFDGTGLHCNNEDYYETPLDFSPATAWDFDKLKRNRKIEKALFYFRGRHKASLKNSILYVLNHRLKFGR